MEGQYFGKDVFFHNWTMWQKRPALKRK